MLLAQPERRALKALPARPVRLVPKALRVLLAQREPLARKVLPARLALPVLRAR